MNEHHVIRKSHDATQKKMSSRGAFNVPCDWFETNSRHQKRYYEGGKKNYGCPGLQGRVVIQVTSGTFYGMPLKSLA